MSAEEVTFFALSLMSKLLSEREPLRRCSVEKWNWKPREGVTEIDMRKRDRRRPIPSWYTLGAPLLFPLPILG